MVMTSCYVKIERTPVTVIMQHSVINKTSFSKLCMGVVYALEVEL